MLAQRIRKYLLYNHRMSCGGQEEPPSSKERENVSATSTTQPAQVEYKKNSGDITKNEAKMLSANNKKMTEGLTEGWKVKEEESHSEECSISIDEQVQDRISVSNWDIVIATEDSVMMKGTGCYGGVTYATKQCQRKLFGKIFLHARLYLYHN